MENEICRARDSYRGEETFVQDLVGNLNGSGHLEDPGVDGDNIKMGLKANRRV
jgi:hypothetical protein